MSARSWAARMTSEAVRTSIDAGDVDALRDALHNHPTLLTALVSAPDIQATSPLTYVGMARFCGSRATIGQALARVLLEAGADKDDETKNGCPLICAASHGDAHVVRAPLDAGADVELTGNPPRPRCGSPRPLAIPKWSIYWSLQARGLSQSSRRPRSAISRRTI
jgi:hypothetical protein